MNKELKLYVFLKNNGSQFRYHLLLQRAARRVCCDCFLPHLSVRCMQIIACFFFVSIGHGLRHYLGQVLALRLARDRLQISLSPRIFLQEGALRSPLPPFSHWCRQDRTYFITFSSNHSILWYERLHAVLVLIKLC